MWTRLSLVVLPIGGLIGGGYFLGDRLFSSKGSSKNRLEENSDSKDLFSDVDKQSSIDTDGKDSAEEASRDRSVGDQTLKNDKETSSLNFENSSNTSLDLKQLEEKDTVHDQDLPSQDTSIDGNNNQASDEDVKPNESTISAQQIPTQTELKGEQNTSDTQNKLNNSEQTLTENPEVKVNKAYVNYSFGTEENPQLSAEYFFAVKKDNENQKGWVKVCARIDAGKQTELEQAECEQKITENWKEWEQKKPRIWLKSEDKKNIKKILESFYPYGNSWLEKEELDSQWYAGDSICTKTEKGVDGNKKEIIVSCVWKEDNLLRR